MTARWPDPDRAIIDRHVAILDLHSMKSRACYRQVLHGFQDVAERYDALGQEVLIAWLRKSAECWAATTRPCTRCSAAQTGRPPSSSATICWA